MQTTVFVYAIDIAKDFSDWFHLKNLMLLPQQKYKTTFKSLLVIIFCNFLTITKLTTSVYGKIIFSIFMTGFQDFMLQKHSVQNIQPSQKSFFQMLKMFMWWYILHFIILICYKIFSIW